MSARRHQGAELAYVADVVRDGGLDAVVVDVGTTPHDPPAAAVDVGPDEVAAHHPGGADAVRSDDRGEAVAAMAVALEAYVALARPTSPASSASAARVARR